MEFPKATIALSVYNVESYLRKSLDCIIKQTFRDIEILCIDDCSKDGTYTILEEYASKDNRIRLLKQPTNMGLSCSRNLAMAEAKGEYILMLDGDDLFDKQMVELAVKKADETSADMVLWDYCPFYDESEIPTNLEVPSRLSSLNISDRQALLRHPGFTWIHLFRVSMLKDLKIHFPEGLTKQDIPVYWEICTQLSDEKIAVLPYRLSYYRQSKTNTTSRKDKSLFSLVKVMDIVEDYIVRKGIYNQYKEEYWRLRLVTLHGLYDSIKPEYKEEVLIAVRSKITQDAIEYYNSAGCQLSYRTIVFYKMLEGKLWYRFIYNSIIAVRTVYRHLK